MSRRPLFLGALLAMTMAFTRVDAQELFASHFVSDNTVDLAISPDERWLGVVTEGVLDNVVFYDLGSGAVAAVFRREATSPAFADDVFEFSPNGERAVALGDGASDQLMIFDTAGAVPTLLASISFGVATLFDFAISLDSQWLAVHFNDLIMGVLFYDLDTGVLGAGFPLIGSGAHPDRSIAFYSGRAAVLGQAGPLAVNFFDLSGAAPVLTVSQPLGTNPLDLMATPPFPLSASPAFAVRAGAGADGVTFYEQDGDLIAAFAASSSPSARRSMVYRKFLSNSGRFVVLGGADAEAVTVFNQNSSFITLGTRIALTTAPVDIAISSHRWVGVRSGAAPDGILFFNAVSPTTTAVTFPTMTASASPTDAIGFGSLDDRAVVLSGAGMESVVLFDLTGPSPAVLATHGLTTAPVDFAFEFDSSILGIRAGNGADGIAFYDASNGSELGVFPSQTTPVLPDAIELSLDGNPAVALGAGGLDAVQIFSLPPTASVPAGGEGPEVNPYLAVNPNPFRTQTRLDFSLQQPGHVRVALFDVQGRQVRVLADETRSAGRQSVSWDGRDAAGETAAAGVYYARIEVDGKLVTGRKVVFEP